VQRTFDRARLQEEYEDAFFRLLMADHAWVEGEELLRENEELQKDPANQPTPLETQSFQRKLGKAIRSRDAKAAASSAYRMLGRVAAVVAIALFATFLVSTVAVQAVRVSVLNFLIGFEDEYTSLRLAAPVEPHGIVDANVFISWSDAYAPTYIPDGFRITSLSNTEHYKLISYMDGESNILHYSEFAGTAEINVDTENAQRVETIAVQGFDGLFVEKDGTLTVAWTDGDRFFIIVGQVTEAEILKIADGVKHTGS
jgi:hypothetical protein